MKKILLFGAMAFMAMGCSKNEEKQEFNSRAADQAFITKVSMENSAAMSVTRLVEQRALATSVADFARTMLAEQMQAHDDLGTIGREGDYVLSDSINAKNRALLDRLNRLSGYSFDTAFLNSQIEWQEQMKSLLQSEADRSDNRALRIFAGKYYPYTISNMEKADSILQTL